MIDLFDWKAAIRLKKSYQGICDMLKRKMMRLFFGKSRKIYVDLGANEGETIAHYLAENPSWLIFGFEPMPDLMAKLKSRFFNADNIILLQKAVSLIDGKAMFYPGVQSNQSSTLLTGKQSEWQVDYDNGYKVETIDFAKWLKINTKPNDKIVIKMDVEGAEYDIIAHLLQFPRLLKRIEEFRVEWHWNRYPQISEAYHNQVRSNLMKLTKVVDWH